MGQYTEIFVNVDLREETPPEVIAALKQICDGESPEGKPFRWGQLFSDMSVYTPSTRCANLSFNEDDESDYGGFWSLLGKGDIKNYDGEIEAFFTWLHPWVDADAGDFIGYFRHETDQEPTLIYWGL